MDTEKRSFESTELGQGPPIGPQLIHVIHDYPHSVVDENDTIYRASVWGLRQPSGLWIGWIEFHALGLASPILSTGRETTQSTRAALEYWATGLGPVYLEGALQRALFPAQQRTPLL